jgi:SNF2 family DNA or RNA helicase
LPAIHWDTVVLDEAQAIKNPESQVAQAAFGITAADHVFLMDPWWNPAVEDQAADRAHRIGQDRPVLVYHWKSVSANSRTRKENWPMPPPAGEPAGA